jgi:small subunit ribosomal protein S11
MKKSVQEPAQQTERRSIKKARMYIVATFNNTIVTVSDADGSVLCWGSAGNSGFKGARRSTPYAATKTVTDVLERMNPFHVEELEVYLKGAGMGREAALRALRGANMRLTLIADITPMPHNGVRPKKKRRV